MGMCINCRQEFEILYTLNKLSLCSGCLKSLYPEKALAEVSSYGVGINQK